MKRRLIVESSSLETKNFDDKFISSRFSSNSEADASELSENFEGMIPRYYMEDDIISGLTHTGVLPVANVIYIE